MKHFIITLWKDTNPLIACIVYTLLFFDIIGITFITLNTIF
jgi:hypothetical protein